MPLCLCLSLCLHALCIWALLAYAYACLCSMPIGSAYVRCLMPLCPYALCLWAMPMGYAYGQAVPLTGQAMPLTGQAMPLSVAFIRIVALSGLAVVWLCGRLLVNRRMSVTHSLATWTG